MNFNSIIIENLSHLNFNFFNVLIVIGIAHGIVFGLIIFVNKNLRSKTNMYLAFSVFALCFSNLQYWLIDIGLDPGYRDNSALFIPFEYLMVPMFYLFVRSYLQHNFSYKLVFFLLTPFLLMLAYHISLLLFNSGAFNLLTEYISLIFCVVLIFLTFKIIFNYEKKIEKIRDDKFVPRTTSWLKKILFYSIILCALWFISLTLFKSWWSDKGLYQFYPLWIGISVLIYWIAYLSIFETSIFRDRIEIRKLQFEDVSQEERHEFKRVNPKKFEEIKALILKNKLYLNPRLNLKDISKETDLSEGYISQLINSNANENFNEFINKMRVNEVKEMFSDERFKNYTITSIGLEAGFNTKSSFYSVFKKVTSTTPNKYKKLVQNL